MLRRTLLASAGAMALAGTAFAADLPSRGPPPVYLPPPPVFSWTGLYVGVNAGYEWSASKSVNTVAFPIFNASGLVGAVEGSLASAAAATNSIPVQNNGFIGGGQIGYNYQFYNSWVAGIEADIQGVAGSNGRASVFRRVPVAGFAPITDDSVTTVRKQLDYLGTVRGRLGFLVTPTLLVYGTGGLAYGGVQSSTSVFQIFANQAALPPFFGAASFSNTRVGWTAGGGLEWMFAPRWSAKVEYLYYDLGTITQSFVLPSLTNAGTLFFTNGVRSTTRFNGNVVRAGLNYHFNWGGAPIIAKY